MLGLLKLAPFGSVPHFSSARVKELRSPAVERAQLTLDGHLEDLKRVQDAAEKEGKYSAAISAEVARGKTAGLYVDRHEHSGHGNAPTGVIIEPAKQPMKGLCHHGKEKRGVRCQQAGV